MYKKLMDFLIIAIFFTFCLWGYLSLTTNEDYLKNQEEYLQKKEIILKNKQERKKW